MNLIEALKSGKKFKRRSEDKLQWRVSFGQQKTAWEFTEEEIIANDWEIEQEPKKKVLKYLWIDAKGIILSYPAYNHAPRFFSEEERKKDPCHELYKKLEWSATTFEE